MATLTLKNDATTEVGQLLIDQVGTDEVATSKLTIGAAGVNDGFVSAANPLPVVAALPTGASTAAKQDTEIASLASLDTKTPALGQALAAGSVPVVLTAAQLSTLTPTADPSTGTNQGTGNASLASIDGKTPTPKTVDYDTGAGDDTVPAVGILLPANGGAVAGGTATNPIRTDPTGATTQPISGAVTIDGTPSVTVSGNAATTVADGANAALGATTDAEATGNGTLIALFKRIRTLLSGGLPAALAANGGLKVEGVSGGVAVPIADGGGSITVDGPVTDTQLRATAVPVSGPITDAEIRATALPVSLTSVPSHAVTNAGTFATQAVPTAAAAGGATPYSYIAAASTNQDSQVVKSSAGQLLNAIVAINVTASLRYLKIYDKASAPTSADTPVKRLPIPASTSGAGFVIPLPVGIAFANGIAFRITTGMADNDANAATANDLIVNLDYK